MSDAPSSDCYLCGARNDLDADFCIRCDGQLLKLPSDALDIAITDPEELIDDAIPDVEEDVVQKPRRRRVGSGSVEDQRLSDALGLLAGDDDSDADGLLDTIVTGVPQAKQSANIPLIGTRTGIVPQSALESKEFGARTYVLLVLLLMATAWLGWSTLTDGAQEASPDNLAFTDSTLPITTTSTTERPRREWSEAESSGRYGGAFHRVLLYDCPSVGPNGETVNIEPLDERWTAGIAVDEHNVIVDRATLPTANVAIIQARNGARRLAIVEAGPSETRISTTSSVISRNLDLAEAPDGEAIFFLTYDQESNAVESHRERTEEPLELVVSNYGELLEARVRRAKLPFDELNAIVKRVEVVTEKDAPVPNTTCDRASQLVTVSTEPTISSEPTSEESEAQ